MGSGTSLSTVILAVSAIYVLATAHVHAASPYRLATFKADVTCPIGHALMGGGIAPAATIVDPLLAKGVALLGPEQPIVILAVDWCEIRNDAYDRWREVLAEAVGTTRERVLVSSVHVHDAPVADLEAQRMLDTAGLPKSLCDNEFNERCVQTVAEALRKSIANTQPITHYGAGKAEIPEIASNRRILLPSGSVAFHRGSATRDPALREQPAGLIDPYLRTLSFWNGEDPVAAISVYATHPMSYYGKGGVSYDFVGMAREQREEESGVFQVYMSGCSGDVTAGKWNDGAPENRPALAGKLRSAMQAAWESTARYPIEKIDFRNTALILTPINAGDYEPEAMKRTLADPNEKTFRRNLAAMGLSWLKRSETGQPIDMPCVDFGMAQVLQMPAEAFVGYQLMAHEVRPDSFVLTPGYGECAPGYITTNAADADGFQDVWRWVGDGCEPVMLAAMRKALLGK